ncbi:tetratricopeptide repeat protein [Oceanithermus sp.]
MRARVVILTLLLVPALAASATGLLNAGRLPAAWEAGREAGALEEVLAAAEAANLMAQYASADEREQRLWLDRAEEAARRAVRRWPDAAEAHYQLAHAQAEKIRFVGVLAKIELASSIKENLDRTLALERDHARAHMGLALWHLQLAKRGLGWFYGASLDAVVPLFEQATALAPESIEIRKNYGFALIELGRPEEARRELERALALPSRNEPDRLHQARARALLDGLGH